MTSISKFLFIAAHIVIFFAYNSIFAQAQQEITIQKAGFLEFTEIAGERTYFLANNVVLQQKDILLYCDTAYLYSSRNAAVAIGNVHINQADTVHAYGDSATYDGNNKIAVLYHNVKLTDRSMILSTENLTYNLEIKTGTYINGGTLDNGDTKLSSELGYYYAQSSDAFFRKNVKLQHPEYALEADTLQYNTEMDRAYFHGPTTIYNKKSKVYCEKGYYDSKPGIAVFNQNVKLENPPQELFADSIFYNRETGIGKAYRNIIFRDTAENVLQYSQYGEYNELTQTLLSTKSPVAAYALEGDTLFIAGDTIRLMEDTAGLKTLLVYYHVRIFKTDLQGVCDSLKYADADSIIYMFGEPVLWSDSTQFSADSIQLAMVLQQLHTIQLNKNALIANEIDSLIYNQVKGRNITGLFQNQELYKVEVRGNAESIYYGQDDLKRYIGVNKAVCSGIDIYIRANKFTRITFKEMPESVFTPMQQVNIREFRLDNFKWEKNKQPKSKEELFYYSGETENPNDAKSLQKEG
ncbi:MAG: OstA-like protein [Chitinophagales bacterium]